MNLEQFDMNRHRPVRQVGIALGALALFLALALAGFAGPALAGIHTWDVNEVFSNADGTIQFVELWESNGTPGETGVGNGTVSSNTQTLPLSGGPVDPPTTNMFYLIATQSFADLPGAPTPDEIIPLGMIPFFSTSGDTVAFVGFDSWTFGTVPTNGTDSLDRLLGVGANTPTNYAGATGSVDASPPPPPPVLVPAASSVAVGMLVALLASAGLLLAWRRQAR